jgi:RecA/RadA recombinase
MSLSVVTKRIFKFTKLAVKSSKILNFSKSKSIDNLLSSGVYTNQILEISGPSFSGKTQFCLCQTLFVSAKTKGTVIYIDTNNSFSDSRLRELHTETKNKDPEIIPFLVTLRDKIKVFKLYEIDSLLSVCILFLIFRFSKKFIKRLKLEFFFFSKLKNLER